MVLLRISPFAIGWLGDSVTVDIAWFTKGMSMVHSPVLQSLGPVRTCSFLLFVISTVVFEKVASLQSLSQS